MATQLLDSPNEVLHQHSSLNSHVSVPGTRWMTHLYQRDLPFPVLWSAFCTLVPQFKMKAHLLGLPNELLLQVFEIGSFADAASLHQVNKQLRWVMETHTNAIIKSLPVEAVVVAKVESRRTEQKEASTLLPLLIRNASFCAHAYQHSRRILRHETHTPDAEPNTYYTLRFLTLGYDKTYGRRETIRVLLEEHTMPKILTLRFFSRTMCHDSMKWIQQEALRKTSGFENSIPVEDKWLYADQLIEATIKSRERGVDFLSRALEGFVVKYAFGPYP
ncbi:hypothetical protein E4T38_02100 [Aureobasidium subglaciale]|nr:hypothetical protein E4T38_02100 [Aureobasidium subglaciale]KAI5228901.1 hypothetical protein E4T40_01794 [Aureobasidium subglaciale]KAI5232711.1 hypothetical protein E4T41_02014 [Aureobasidium subglaciale]KAI5266093.1 hypothetical protein E4T46_01877 [Aureobasidium subglaciale]